MVTPLQATDVHVPFRRKNLPFAIMSNISIIRLSLVARSLASPLLSAACRRTIFDLKLPLLQFRFIH